MSKNENKDENKTDSNKVEDPLLTTSEEKTAEQEVKVETNPLREQQKRASIAILASIVFIGILSFVILDDRYLNLDIGFNTSSVVLSSYWHKLEFVVCYQTIGISWILFNMFYVISKRIKTKAIDPTDPESEANVLVAKNIMQNSIEQFLMSAFAQIISISFIDKSILIKVIPLINILFVIGRITFWLGYPKYRTFGFMCSAIPNTLLINYNLIKFIQSLFF
jgi:hypothetical protein